MISRAFRRSWALIKASWTVLKSQPSLLVFPVLGLLAFIVLVGFIVGGGFLLTGGFSGGSEPGTGQKILGFAILGLGYYVFSFATIFFNTALAGCVLDRLRGGNPTVASGLALARSRIGAIAGYAAIVSIVAWVLNVISEKLGAFGQITAALGGFAWGVATAFVMPVLAAENVGPVDAITRSSNLLKRTFGTQITGSASLSALMVLPMLLIALLGVGLLGLSSNSGSDPLRSAGIVVLVIGLGVLPLLTLPILGVMQQIFLTAVYHYASSGEPDPYFSDDLLRSAFVSK